MLQRLTTKGVGIFCSVPTAAAKRLNSLSPSRLMKRALTTSSGKKGKKQVLVDTMRQRVSEDSSWNKEQSWEQLWQEGTTPWDLNAPTPALKAELDAMEWNTKAPTNFRILVPGCGSGYDLITLAQHQDQLWHKTKADGEVRNSMVVGLDISSTSLRRAEKVLSDFFINDAKEATISESTHVVLVRGDFFDYKSWQVVYSSTPGYTETSTAQPESFHEGFFDLIYDYVFFCALPPVLRERWGSAMSTLLKNGHGRLLTLMFPVLQNAEKTKGPPYPVTVDDYRTVLESRGVLMESQPYASPHTIPPRAGKELVCWWKRQENPRSLI